MFQVIALGSDGSAGSIWSSPSTSLEHMVLVPAGLMEWCRRNGWL